MIAVIVDMRWHLFRYLRDLDRDAVVIGFDDYLSAVRHGLTTLINLQFCQRASFDFERAEPIAVVACRTDPDDCELILQPPYSIVDAYDAIQWLKSDLDSMLVDGFAIPSSLRNIAVSNAASFKCLEPQLFSVSRVFFISPLLAHAEQHTDIGAVPTIPTTVIAVATGSFKEAEQRIHRCLCKHGTLLDVVVISNDELEWTSVFWDVRQESLQNFSLALSLNSLTPFQANPQPLLELSCRHFFEVIDLPQWVQVCECHGRSATDIVHAMSNGTSPGLQVGLEYCPSKQVPEEVADNLITCRTLQADHFIPVDDVCETKLIGQMFVAWSRRLALLVHGCIPELRPKEQLLLNGVSARFIMIPATSSPVGAPDSVPFALIRMCLFVEQLLPWMATVENSSSDDPYSEDDAMLFDSIPQIHDVSELIVSNAFHDIVRDAVQSIETRRDTEGRLEAPLSAQLEA
ncbi:unnamed protein product (mitochondrion) [Plasmodiophora brassicae]|uniref:Uncharacterized protein n=1 Tax=Plasmodiophora brassicae TaxID=37360 RepID=A0A3P3Y1E8_PLABS|nr:unnamed protein product [Plasmodiophora brassicae]